MRDTLIIAAALLVLATTVLALFSQRGGAKGLRNGRLEPVGLAPNAVSSVADTENAAKVEPLRTTLANAKRAVEQAGGTVVSETDNYLAATFASRLFRFIDDLELHDVGDDTVHIRSASRVGHSDFGANRKRVERIRALVEQLPD